MMTMARLRSILALAALLFAAPVAAQVTLTHVHGLSYSSDGTRLMIPSHHGLAVYENGKWSKAPGPQHDYMGFTATSRYLYSSGHPAPGSGLVEPLGLVRSRDGGKTWEKLGLEGETDFHILAASWNVSAVYAWNPEPSSRMRRPGLHYTLNDGFAWKPAQARGLAGKPHGIAVHPDNATAVALATSSGVFESTDSGESFAQIAGGQGTAVYFDLGGRHLWYGAYDGQARLARVALKGGPATLFQLPPLTNDAVAYIAQNPARRSQYAIATFERDVYLSTDGARTWTAIAVRGRAK